MDNGELQIKYNTSSSAVGNALPPDRISQRRANALFVQTEKMILDAATAVSEKLQLLRSRGRTTARLSCFNVRTDHPDFTESLGKTTRRNPYVVLSGNLDITYRDSDALHRLSLHCVVPGNDGRPGAEQILIQAQRFIWPHTHLPSHFYEGGQHSSTLDPTIRSKNVVFKTFMYHLIETLGEELASEVLRDAFGIKINPGANIRNMQLAATPFPQLR